MVTYVSDLYEVSLAKNVNDFSSSIRSLKLSNYDGVFARPIPIRPRGGTEGNDVISGGNNNDTILGKRGDDWLYGGLGRNKLKGGPGNDHLMGEGGPDILKGGPGFDFAYYSNASFGVSVFLRSGTARHENLYIAEQYRFVDTLRGIEGVVGSPSVDLIAGDNRTNALLGYAGDDSIFGGGGRDLVVGGMGNDSLVGGGGRDLLVGDLLYESGDDTIVGEGGNDFLLGGLGEDVLDGGSGADILEGGTGNDVLSGGTGNDVLEGETGDDVLEGGKGKDAASYRFANGPVSVGLWIEGNQDTGADGRDVLTGIEDLFGSDFNDLLEGDHRANALLGYGGDDTLDGLKGMDLLVGGPGNDFYVVDSARDRIFEFVDEGTDRVDSFGSYKLPAHVEMLILTGTGADKAIGNKLDNWLVGNANNNKIVGGKGDDVIVGGNGQDVLIGGPGADLFVLEDAAFSGVGERKRDVIKDFMAVQGDRIDLSPIDANGKSADGDQAFEFVGTVDFAATPGGPRPSLLRFEKQLLQADLDGDGDADMELGLPGVKALDLNDFLL